MASNSNFPNPAFLFSASLWGQEVKFQEISGIKAEMGFKEVRSGGINNQVYKIPTVASYGDVTFKKGIINASEMVSSTADLFKRIKDLLHINAPYSLLNKTIGTIVINLNNEEGKSVCTWALVNPSLLSWEISTFNAQNNELAFETLVFSCSEIISSVY
jgi:phage tail-like protein